MKTITFGIALELLKMFGLYGSILAIIISWNANRSALWAVVHGFLGWAYVIWKHINQ